MVDNSNNWSLAGDVALLNSLKSFGDNLLTRINQIDTKLHNLTDSLDEANLQLNIAENKFQSLRNTQFIESRVYEDDETLPTTATDNKENSKLQTEHKPTINQMKLAISKGLQIIDEYFDKVEVSVSDSEDETDFPNYVLRPKDPYINRPLPYVIGTEEWHKNWHVGLEDSSSDSENEKVSEDEKFSESSDNEQHVQKKTNNKSDNSSELEFVNKKPTTDLFDESHNNNNNISSDISEQNSMPVQAPINNQIFAEQLAAKLGNVIINKTNDETEINKRPIVQTNRAIVGDLFSDEPPPLDESFEETKKGLFSSDGGLFDDYVYEKKSVIKTKVEDLFDENKTKPITITAEEKKSVDKPKFKGIFDDKESDDDDDDDIFSNYNKKSMTTSTTTATNKPFLQTLKPSNPPLFNDEPPDLDEIQPTKKKPTGGVSIFGKSDLFSNEKFEDLLKNQRKSLEENTFNNNNNQQTIENEENKISIKNVDDNNQIKSKENVKKTGLFDDDDFFANDDLFKNIPTTSTTKKLASNLFDDDDDDTLFNDDLSKSPIIEKTNLFSDVDDHDDNKDKKGIINKSSSVEESSNVKIPAIIDLFDPTPPLDDDNWDRKSDIFDDNIESYTYQQKDDNNSLFDNEPPLLESDDFFIAGNDNKITTPIKQSNILKTNKISLFDDEPPPLFLAESTGIESNISSNNSIVTIDDKPIIQSTDNDNQIKDSNKMKKTLSLFDDEPPLLEEEINDFKIGNESNISEIQSTDNKMKKTLSLFDDDNDNSSDNDDLFSIKKQKQSKETTPSKPVFSSPGKLKVNLNINVNALIPGSIPNKKDLIIINKSKSSNQNIDDNLIFNNDNSNEIEILQSATKSRAKLPLNRRPSTRKGRQEALRKSVLLDDDDNFNDKCEEKLIEKSNDNNKFEPIKNMNLIQQSNDEINKSTNDKSLGLSLDVNDDKLLLKQTGFDDLFSSNSSNKIENVSRQKTISLFDDNDDDKRQENLIEKSDDNKKFEPIKTVNLIKQSDDKINKSSNDKPLGLSLDVNDDKLVLKQTVFDDDLFSSNSSSEIENVSGQKTISLFDDDNDKREEKLIEKSDDNNKFEPIKNMNLIKQSDNKINKSSNDKPLGLSLDVNDDKLVLKQTVIDDDLFSSNPSNKIENVSRQKKKSLFDDDDDDNSDSDDNIFSRKIKTQTSKVFNKKKSLFDDDDDDNGNIFQSTSTVPTNKDISSIKKMEIERKSSRKIRKLENIQSDDDPLSDLLR